MKNNQLLLLLGTFLFSVCVSAQVGINTSTPSATLDVASQGSTATTKALKVSNSLGTEMITVRNQGNVGISVQDPQKRLDVDANNNTLRVRNLPPTDKVHNTDGSMRFLSYNTDNEDVYQKILRNRELVTIAGGTSVTLTDPTASLNGTIIVRSAITTGVEFMATLNYARRALGLLGITTTGAAEPTYTRSVSGSIVYNLVAAGFNVTITKPANTQITITNNDTVSRDFYVFIEPIL